MYWKGKYVFSATCACVCVHVCACAQPPLVRAGWAGEEAKDSRESRMGGCHRSYGQYLMRMHHSNIHVYSVVYNFVCVYRQGVRPCCQSCLLTRLSARTPAQPVWRSRMWKSKCPPTPFLSAELSLFLLLSLPVLLTVGSSTRCILMSFCVFPGYHSAKAISPAWQSAPTFTMRTSTSALCRWGRFGFFFLINTQLSYGLMNRISFNFTLGCSLTRVEWIHHLISCHF